MLYTDTNGVNTSENNFIFQLAEELSSNFHQVTNTRFNSLPDGRNRNLRKDYQIGLYKKTCVVMH